MTFTRRLTALAAGLAVAATTAITAALPAAADAPGLTGFTVSDVTVGKTGCIDVPVKGEGTWANYDSVSAQITRPDGNPATSVYLSTSNGFSSTFLLCASSVVFGKHTIAAGAAQQTFNVRAASGVVLKAEHFNAKKTTFTVLAANFDYQKGSYADEYYVPLKSGKVAVQQKSGSSWKTVTTLNVKKGKASTVVKVAKKGQYRAVYSGSTTVAPATSKAVKVTKVKTATTIKATTGLIGKAKLTIKVTPKTAKGTVTILDGNKVLKKLTLDKKGKAVYPIPRGMKAGAHTFTAKFTPAKKKFVKASKDTFAGVIY